MPLGRFLKILLSALFALAVAFIVAVQYSGIQPAGDIQNFATYEQIAREYFNYGRDLVMRTIEWLRGLSHDDWLTFAIVLMAIFTAGLWRSTSRLWKASEDQIKLARDAFSATHRPRIVVRRMGVELVKDAPIIVEFAIVNTGEEKVIKCNWNTVIMLLNVAGGVHGQLHYETDTADFHNGPLSVGEGTKKWIEDKTSLAPSDFADIEKKKVVLHVVGYVAYTDRAGVTRQTGFFRYYDAEKRRFHVIDDPEYEYQD
jgi:hypothetical protein